MLRFSLPTVATALAVALLLPGAADARRPVHGTFFNGSESNGMFFSTHRLFYDKGRDSIPDLQFYCKRTRYDIQELVVVSHNGHFSYHGRAQKYGNSGQPLGAFNVTIKRRLSGCNTKTVRALGKRAS
jgi:hypothetical protein